MKYHNLLTCRQILTVNFLAHDFYSKQTHNNILSHNSLYNENNMCASTLIRNIMKYLLAIISSLFITPLALAQSSANQNEILNTKWYQSRDIALGAYIGLSNNTLSLHDVGDFTIAEFEDINGVGFLVGLQADYFFGKNWSIKGRINCENRDYGFDESDNLISGSVEAAWHFGKNRRWHLALGPAYNGNLDSTLDSGIGGAFSIGVIVPISNLNFFIELDGISQLNATEAIFSDNDGNIIAMEGLDSNRSSINIGILF